MIDAFGGCCVYDESSREPEGEFGSLGWLLAGEQALTLSNLNDSQLTELVLENLPACLQHGRPLVLESRVHRYSGAVNGLPGGRPLRETDSRHLPEPTQHNRLFVVGDYLFDSTINGCVDSADVVAECIIEKIKMPQATVAGPTTIPAISSDPIHLKR